MLLRGNPILLSPAGRAHPAIPIAASRNGAVGAIDLQFSADTDASVEAVFRIRDHAEGAWGIKLDFSCAAEVNLTRSLPAYIPVIILCSPAWNSHSDLARSVAAWKERGSTVLVEVTDADQALEAQRFAADGVIAKGNESGGWVGEETSFVLMQRLLKMLGIRVWVQGGMGFHSASACDAAGAAGVVFEDQLSLLRESGLPEFLKHKISQMDGSETACLGSAIRAAFRLYSRPGMAGAEALQDLASRMGQASLHVPDEVESWIRAVQSRASSSGPDGVLPIGQAASFAKAVAERCRTVGGFVSELRESVGAHVTAAKTLCPLAPDGPLARSHGTRFPIVQGPMTRVSDCALFASAVARAGGLPFVALALMRADEIRRVLTVTQERLGAAPWGVGILGFVPLDLRTEQLEVVKQFRPPFALIAGGRPEQAQGLEELGIRSYIHVPSPGLLRLYLESGSRRFVFEGRECGGHVGPRSSFVLWDTMIDVLLECVPPSELPNCHVLFAGGIHDDISAASVSALAGTLARAGVKIGVLMGTAYLFTQEVVETGAIVEGFQREALNCRTTILLETGPGHSTRCAETPYFAAFEQERRRLVEGRTSAEELRNQLEALNLGRLRIAAKGIERNAQYGIDHSAPRLVPVLPEDQRRRGMYMIGQVAALRSQICSIAELHHQVSVVGSERLANLVASPVDTLRELPREEPADIAIIGLGCILPKSPNVRMYWDNILENADCITEIPGARFDSTRYFDPDPAARDKIYSRWGGFIDPVLFDSAAYGIPPASVPSIEPLQLLTLEAVRAALDDAGYSGRKYDKQRTSVIIGAGGGVADLGNRYAVRAALPSLFSQIPPEVYERLPEWTEDSFPGLLLNVVAGRVANRFDLGGMNCTIDAACASSLAALYLGAKELETNTSDMVIVGGVDTVQNPFGYLCFSKTHALSPAGRSRPFDESSDGIVISEGLSTMVLKRLKDAEQDGDRIYAVIKSVAASSDGKALGLTAPRKQGQELALKRAYAKAGFSPATVGMIEAHGTGTTLGDQTEIETLSLVFQAAGALPGNCALGSVKSNIGHTKCSAGMAALIKCSLALHHKVLPPTRNVTKPNPKLKTEGNPFVVNTELRPWIKETETQPRRAGVSSFGFGGTNFHVALEEYSTFDEPSALTPSWPAELILFGGASRIAIAEQVEALAAALRAGARPLLRDLSFSLWTKYRAKLANNERLAFVCSSIDELAIRLEAARKALAGEATDRPDIWYSNQARRDPDKVAFLFPGQGSQYVAMLRDLAVHFPEVRRAFETATAELSGLLPRPLKSYIFPGPAFDKDERRHQQEQLTQTDIAQPALGAANFGLFKLLRALGVKAECVGGHSYGEYVALCVGGAFSDAVLARLSHSRGLSILEAQDSGSMIAALGTKSHVEQVLGGLSTVWIANLNAPRECIVSGTPAGIDQAIERLRCANIEVRKLAVSCAFHSPLIAGAQRRFAEILKATKFAKPRIPVYSNTTAAPYPEDPQQIVEQLSDHLIRQVRFQEQIERMHEDGVRIFIECGPRGILTRLVDQILVAKPHLALSCDAEGESGHVGLLRVLGKLLVADIFVDCDRLYRDRNPNMLDLANLVQATRLKPVSSTSWLIDGGGAYRATEPRPTTCKPPISLAASRPTGDGQQRPSAPHSPPPTVAKPNGTHGAMDAMGQFQGLMSRFLETQRKVMLAALRDGRDNGIMTSPERPASNADVVAAPMVEAPPSDPVGKPEGIDRPAFAAYLLQVVTERTGYPAELVDQNADLDADLGIDSIKRVEIVGLMRKKFLSESNPPTSSQMESLTQARTLNAIVDWFTRVSDGSAEPFAGQHGEGAKTADPPNSPPLRTSKGLSRFVFEAEDDPLAVQKPAKLSVKDLILITDDETGVAERLFEKVRFGGGRAVLVQQSDGKLERSGAVYRSDLRTPRAVQDLLNSITEYEGPLSAICHLLPLHKRVAFNQADRQVWQEESRLGTKLLFLLVKGCADQLPAGSVTSHVQIFAATNAGPALLHHDFDQPFFPVDAGVAGFLKTASADYPKISCRVAHLDTALPPESLADVCFAELLSPGGTDEVYYSNRRRKRFRTVPKPLQEVSEYAEVLDRSAVILVTGGARGITADVTRALAERYQPTLILVGRTELSSVPEPRETSGIESDRQLKTHLAERMRGDGQAPRVAEVEREFAKLIATREIRKSIASMERVGARVEYVSADVSNEREFVKVLQNVYARYGRIDGVIHGAGVIHDRLVTDKSDDTFSEVFDTKSNSAFTLLRNLIPEQLKFVALFSSVAGAFPSRGQSDYAAANEVMNKLGLYYQQQWNKRIISFAWGPWAKGMAESDTVQRQFRERGIEIIPPALGVDAFLREIRFGTFEDVEVVIGNGPWQVVEPAAAAARSQEPILSAASNMRDGDRFEWILELDPRKHRYLLDHQMDGKPVFPMAFATELMAEAALGTSPDLVVTNIRDLQVLRGIVLDGGSAKSLRITARSAPAPTPRGRSLSIEVWDHANSGRCCYRCVVDLECSPLGSATLEPDRFPADSFPHSVDMLYRNWLFHGPLFHSLYEIEGASETGMAAYCRPSDPAQCIAEAPSRPWLVDPVVLDCGLQMVIIWARFWKDVTPLPARYANYRRIRPAGVGPVRCQLQVNSYSEGNLVDVDIFFALRDGELIGELRHLECACSKALNRLALASAQGLAG